LRGFKRVARKAGEKKTVELVLAAKSLAHWDTPHHCFMVEPGKIEIQVGSSSFDIRLTKNIDVTN